MTGQQHHLRFLEGKESHRGGAFGSDAFGRGAERVARFFGTPQYIVGQTLVVAIWIAVNTSALIGVVHFDRYPYILLNLAFSLQAAYAAPLILLAQTRQADRERMHAEADAAHREELSAGQVALLRENTRLTEEVADLSRKIHALTTAIAGRVDAPSPPGA